MGSRIALICVCALALAGGCKPKAPPDDGKAHTVQRTDYAPEDFGIGRQHTPDTSCNRDIDRLLDEVRLCFRNRGATGACDSLQKRNAERIARLKNTVRCAR